MKRNPTIIDLAKYAGVSKSTVSRALSENRQGIREKTLRSVLKAVEDLGYERNIIASSMRTDRTYVILLAIPDITNPYWSEVARGVQDVMDNQNYAVVFANSDWDDSRERRYIKMSHRNRFDGILINPVQLHDQDLWKAQIPTVLLGETKEYPHFDVVGSDSYGASMLALTHLLSLGHRRIGVILGRRHRQSPDPRREAYHDALRSAGLPFDEQLIVLSSFTQNGGFEAMQRLLDSKDPPTTVFCANDLIAIGALQAAHEQGYRVPQDISVIGLDDIYAAITTTPPLTTVAKPKYEIGRQAAQYLLERINRRAPEAPRRLSLAGRLVVRSTTGPPRR